MALLSPMSRTAFKSSERDEGVRMTFVHFVIGSAGTENASDIFKAATTRKEFLQSDSESDLFCLAQPSHFGSSLQARLRSNASRQNLAQRC